MSKEKGNSNGGTGTKKRSRPDKLFGKWGCRNMRYAGENLCPGRKCKSIGDRCLYGSGESKDFGK